VLAYEEKLLGTEEIVAACLDRYRAAAIPARPVAWDRIGLDYATVEQASVIVTDRHLDWVLSPHTRPDDHTPLFRRLDADGWTIHVVVPLESLGETHAALRTAPVLLQAWWADGGGVHFGRPEIP
jgi:hypothetical protein